MHIDAFCLCSFAVLVCVWFVPIAYVYVLLVLLKISACVGSVSCFVCVLVMCFVCTYVCHKLYL